MRREWPCGAPIEEDNMRDYCGPCEAGECPYKERQNQIIEAMENKFIAQVGVKGFVIA